MKKLLPLLFAILSSAVYGQDTTGVKKDSVQDPPWAMYHSIETRLDTVFDEWQVYRKSVQSIASKYGEHSRQLDSLVKAMDGKDSITRIWVKGILDHYGWLGIDDIGEKANTALFLAIHHGDSLTQTTYLPMVREAVKNRKAQPDQLALLEDRVLTNQGKPQIYGTQVRTLKNGKNVFFPISDERNVNKRRSAVGLEPLEAYARYFGIDYHLPK